MVYEISFPLCDLEIWDLEVWIRSSKGKILLTKEAKAKGYKIKEINIKEDMPGIDIIINC